MGQGDLSLSVSRLVAVGLRVVGFSGAVHRVVGLDLSGTSCLCPFSEVPKSLEVLFLSRLGGFPLAFSHWRGCRLGLGWLLMCPEVSLPVCGRGSGVRDIFQLHIPLLIELPLILIQLSIQHLQEILA